MPISRSAQKAALISALPSGTKNTVAALRTALGSIIDNGYNVTEDGTPIITVTKATIGLPLVENLAPLDYPLSTASINALAGKADNATVNAKADAVGTTNALAGKASLTGATFTGPVNVPTQAAGNNSTLAASTAFVSAAVAAGGGGGGGGGGTQTEEVLTISDATAKSISRPLGSSQHTAFITVTTPGSAYSVNVALLQTNSPAIGNRLRAHITFPATALATIHLTNAGVDVAVVPNPVGTAEVVPVDFEWNGTAWALSTGTATRTKDLPITASSLAGDDFVRVDGATNGIRKAPASLFGGSGGFASPTTTKGDLIVRNSSTDVRQPVGTDGQVLTADSTQATGQRWATPAASTGAGITQTQEVATVTYASVSNGDIVICNDMPHGGTITQVSAKTDSGTATVAVKINSTPLGGSANSASSTRTRQVQSSANVFVAGDSLSASISSASSVVNLSLTIKYTRNLNP